MRTISIEYCSEIPRSESVFESSCRHVERFTFDAREIGRCAVFQQEGLSLPQLSSSVDLCFGEGVNAVNVQVVGLEWSDCTDVSEKDRPFAHAEVLGALRTRSETITVERCESFTPTLAAEPVANTSALENFELSVSGLAVRETTGCAGETLDGAFLAVALLFARKR
jgi:hypothetical protein